MSDNEILGKTFSELVPVTEAKKSALIAIDNGESECNTISVENLLKDIEPSKGSGFDFEGTKSEFNNAVTSGEITDDSVSLITDDYSSVDGQIGALAEQLNNKVDLPTGKSQSDVDYVVESKFPTDADPSWYRVYKSGWLEQGGRVQKTSTELNVTMTKAFADVSYALSVTACYPGSGDSTVVVRINTTVTTSSSFRIQASWTSSSGYIQWEAKGQGAN